MAAYVYQTPTFPPHDGDKVKVKSQHICQAIPVLLRGLGEAVWPNANRIEIIFTYICVFWWANVKQCFWKVFFYFKVFQVNNATIDFFKKKWFWE